MGIHPAAGCFFLAKFETDNPRRIQYNRENKEILSPGLAAIILGVALFLMNIQLPPILGVPVQTIGSATTPLAMLIVGYQLGRMKVKNLFNGKVSYLLAAIKLLLLPLIVIAGLRIFVDEISLFMKIIVLIAALPAATCSIIFAEKYETRADFAAKGVVLTTILSLVTLPAIAFPLEIL